MRSIILGPVERPVVDRDGLVRNVRRREALDALVFERDREVMLEQQLDDTVAEIESQRVDAGLYAQMSPEDAGLVRAALGQDLDGEPGEEADPNDDGFELSLGFDGDEAELGETVDDVEEEIARLQAELESSRRVQAALERYLELLSGPPAG